jgi:hypothetical protein
LSAEVPGHRRTSGPLWPGAGTCLVLAFLLLAGAGWAGAATGKFHYQAGLNETYSQDILRNGSNQPGYITDLSFTANLQIATPRSNTTFNYLPEYLMYEDYPAPTDTAEPVSPNHLDQLFFGLWQFRASPRSDVAIRQGYSNTTRRIGFQDLTGAGGGASQPVTNGLTRLQALDLEPTWTLRTGPNATMSLDALFRAQRYNRSDLVDSNQYGLQWGMETRVGRDQRLGGRIRTDSFDYWQDSGPVSPVYNKFVTGEATWALAGTGRSTVTFGAGMYRGQGSDVNPVTGPVLDAAGTWRWRRASLFVAGGIGYASGGGLSTTDTSRHVEGGWSGAWGQGYQVALTLSYIRREPIEGQVDAGGPLYGRSSSATLSRSWHSGFGFRAEAAALRQDVTTGNGLSYAEMTLGLTYAPPIAAPKPIPAGEPGVIP